MGARRSFKSPLSSALDKTTALLRLDLSTPVSAEWASVVDLKNPSNPAVQTDADRKPAVGAADNGLPTALFDGTDVLVWIINAALSSRTKKGFGFWFNPSSVAATQFIYSIIAGAGAATVNQLQIGCATSGAVFVRAYVSAFAGRQASSVSVLSAGTWYWLRTFYDSSRGGDACVRVWIDGVEQTDLVFVDLGAGGTLGVLPDSTGNLLIGGVTDDDDTPNSPILNGGQLGPLGAVFSENLTAAEETHLSRFLSPKV